MKKHVEQTSLDAYEASKLKVPVQQKIMELLENEMLTGDEIADKLGLATTQVRPRLTGLRKEGRIVDSGDRRPTPLGQASIVWKHAGEDDDFIDFDDL